MQFAWAWETVRKEQEEQKDMDLCASDCRHPSYVSCISQAREPIFQWKRIQLMQNSIERCAIDWTLYSRVQKYNRAGVFIRAPEFRVVQREHFAEWGEEPEWGAHWPLMFWAVAALQTNSPLQKHLKVGLIAVNFGCLKVRRPGQATHPGLFLQPTARPFCLPWMLTLWRDESLKPIKPAFLLLKIGEVNPLIINSFSQFVNDFWKWKLGSLLILGSECCLSPGVTELDSLLAELHAIIWCHQLEERFAAWFWVPLYFLF